MGHRTPVAGAVHRILKSKRSRQSLCLRRDSGPAGFGNLGSCANEAMACGLPILVSDQVGCGPDLAVSGQTGEIYSCGDVEKLAKILQELSGRPDRLQEMGEAARRRIEGYSIERAAQRMAAALARFGREPSQSL